MSLALFSHFYLRVRCNFQILHCKVQWRHHGKLKTLSVTLQEQRAPLLTAVFHLCRSHCSPASGWRWGLQLQAQSDWVLQQRKRPRAVQPSA